MRRVVAVALVSIVAVTLSAQQAVTTTADSQAKNGMAQSLGVMTGGMQISDATLSATFHWVAGTEEHSGTATLKALGLSESSVDLQASDWRVTEVRSDAAANGAGAWRDSAGTVHPIAVQNANTDAAWFFPPLTSLADTSDPALAAADLGPQDFHGAPAELYLYWRTDQGPGGDKLSVTELFLDPNTLLPLGIVFNAHPDNDSSSNIAVEIRYSNYQVINGVRIPCRVQKYMNSALVLDLTITSATFNTGLDVSQFSL